MTGHSNKNKTIHSEWCHFPLHRADDRKGHSARGLENNVCSFCASGRVRLLAGVHLVHGCHQLLVRTEALCLESRLCPTGQVQSVELWLPGRGLCPRAGRTLSDPTRDGSLQSVFTSSLGGTAFSCHHLSTPPFPIYLASLLLPIFLLLKLAIKRGYLSICPMFSHSYFLNIF